MTLVGIKGKNCSNFIHSDKFREVLTWTIPPITPVIRYALDKKDAFEKTQNKPELREKKNKLLNRDLVRDVAIYSLGTALYFTSLFGIDKVLEKTTKMAKKNRKVASFLGALAINVAYVSAGASRLSKAILKRQKINVPNEYIYSRKINSLKAVSLNEARFNERTKGTSGSFPMFRAKSAFLNFSVYNKLNNVLLNNVLSKD